MFEANLMDRVDTKFVFNIRTLPAILEQLIPHYSVLDIDNNRMLGYGSHYFDTDDLLFFRQHHNGWGRRFKVRYRHYIESDARFFEIKCKNNKNRTVKKRISATSFDECINCNETEFLHKTTGLTDMDLVPKLDVYYSRISLINKELDERMTIDVNLNLRNCVSSLSIPDLVIAEMKQTSARRSEFLNIMRKNHVRTISISKYCIGISSLIMDVKQNNFKPNLLYINKLCHE